MSLEDEIQDKFKADKESILEDNLGRAEGLFKYHDDGSIQLGDPVRNTSIRPRILTYLIAQRFMYEAGDADTDALSNEFFYNTLESAESTVRKNVMNFRDDGYVSTDEGEHRIIVENLPLAFDYLESQLDE